MAKHKNSWTEERIKKKIKEGKGTGEGINYKPWLTIQDFPSKGLVTRTVGWKTNRIHHFFSKLERDYFYLCEWDEKIIDIREQFPLHREDTLKIASDKNIKHPLCPINQIPIVMTTDFILTVNTSKGIKTFARTIKPSKELDNNRIIEKFEIERFYWKQRGVDWGIVTEKEISKQLVTNIEWVYSAFFLYEELSSSSYQSLLSELKILIQNDQKTLIEIFTNMDIDWSLERGTALYLFKHLIANQEIIINMEQPKS
ncbi:TnsA endonuclease N-terminal domain-containing protein [Gottfriedia acidiceleris]|uniref:TnsA endonuclease N-terminal domain-containing protein n=1 Tax=Gottfriedia acidiceleris TaxID=371036 RepID=A0ABY4JM39_9BACI|nr:TnsA endonuclease N-terminal domain-containing protein [Gottfriedia acidiceleris]UPM54532.1 TnsA endonuclease N-terminal domain-containing protein [Gottfriedia acidiceleris]